MFNPNYKPTTTIFPIQPPAIESGYIYHFTTPSQLLYEVRFARKNTDFQSIIVNFSVLSDEFEHEYSETNRGELYGIIATVIEVVRLFHNQHTLANSYEFSGEFKSDENRDQSSIRTRLYFRYAQQVLNNYWKPLICLNKVILKKI